MRAEFAAIRAFKKLYRKGKDKTLENLDLLGYGGLHDADGHLTGDYKSSNNTTKCIAGLTSEDYKAVPPYINAQPHLLPGGVGLTTPGGHLTGVIKWKSQASRSHFIFSMFGFNERMPVRKEGSYMWGEGTLPSPHY